MARLMTMVTIAVGVLVAAIDASAGPIAPSKPSQIVTVFGTGDSPPCANIGALRQIEIVSKPEGGNAPFAFPKGSVFVATSFEWRVSGLAPGGYTSVTLLGVGPSGEPGTRAGSPGPVGADGTAYGTGVIPSGLIVKPPATLCAGYPFGTTSGFLNVHGFFTKDK